MQPEDSLSRMDLRIGNRRNVLRLWTASLVVPLFASIGVGCDHQNEESTGDKARVGKSARGEQRNQSGAEMKIHYLEIVTSDVDALCNQYAATCKTAFSEPDVSLGGARTAALTGGGFVGIRGPLRETETPVVRPYVLVDDIQASVAAAAEGGAEVAIASMAIPGHGTIAVVIQGGIETGMWQVEDKS